MSRIISKAELARWAGVARSTATRACASVLLDATYAEGVDAEHPLTIEWLEKHGVHELPAPSDAGGTKPAKRPSKRAAGKTPSPKTSATRPASATLPMAVNHENLENLTVREVTMRYGTMDGFKRYVDSLKSIAEYKYRELRAKQQRGQLIERDKVVGVVFPLIEVAFSRLVTDVPDSVSKLVIARVESGGPDTTTDVQKIIRDANSRVLKNVKQSAMRLELLSDAN